LRGRRLRPAAATLAAVRSARVLCALSILGVVATSTGAVAAAPKAALFLAPQGSDSAPCTSAAPCRSLAAAYRLAQPGQVVELRGGSYPAQMLESAGKSGAPVVFRAAPGAHPTLTSLIDHASHVTFSGLTMGLFWKVENGADGVTLRNVTTKVFTIRSASNVSVIGGSVGPWDSNKLAPIEDSQVGEWEKSRPQPTHILIDGVRFHDFTHHYDPSAHTECLQFMAGIDVTIENNRFRNCDADDIYIRGDFGPIRNFLIQNNFFAHAGSGFFTVRLSGPTAPFPCENVLVRYNSALERMWSDCPAAGARGVRFSSNIISLEENYHCTTSEEAGVKWDHNVIESGVKCGPTDVVAPVVYRNRGALDLHLKRAGSGAAIDHGDPTSFPATDIDGQHRPKGAGPDAGADEVG
jgi:hypothetical protein